MKTGVKPIEEPPSPSDVQGWKDVVAQDRLHRIRLEAIVAAIQVIVYAGAIMVLFVFVIMLLNAGAEERSAGSKIALVVGVPGALVLGALVGWIMIRNNKALGSVSISPTDFGETHFIARLLFRDFLLPFEVTSVLILIAIMGAVVLGRKES